MSFNGWVETRVGQALKAFFRANAGEWLTAEDAAAKFNCSVAYAQNCLSGLSGDGVVERISIYRLRPAGGAESAS